MTASFGKQFEVSQDVHSAADNCLHWQLEKLVSCLSVELSHVTRDILLLEHKDWNLLDLESALDKALFDLSLSIEKLLSD